MANYMFKKLTSNYTLISVPKEKMTHYTIITFTKTKGQCPANNPHRTYLFRFLGFLFPSFSIQPMQPFFVPYLQIQKLCSTFAGLI